jgi:hypothetical protein
MTGRIKKAKKQRELEELVLSVLISYRQQGAMQWTDWYETTRARRGKWGLGTGTFSETVKRLTAKGQVQTDGDGCYQVAFDAGDAMDAMDVDSVTDAANSPAVETERFSEVFREGGNGNADIADIALQQLLDTEA